ncbi:MAG: T9SS type A sorting domain-containing protein [Bacteroidales bacterium]|nr:T9SS type A sorting domain-containing protein [Bacteroidales bacterium]
MQKLVFFFTFFLSVQVFSQEILTIGEVFDFDIGDEFHYTNNLGMPSGTRKKVIEKRYSPTNDTVYYKMETRGYSSTFVEEPEMHLEYNFGSGIQDVKYTDLDSSIFYYYTFINISDLETYEVQYSYDSIIGFEPNFCNTYLCGYHAVIGDFEPSTYRYIYGKGIGFVYCFVQYGDSGGLIDQDNGLIYYKKIGKTCGTPDLTGVNEKVISTDEILIFPNPASSQLTIQLNNEPLESCKIEFFNIQGELLDSKILEGKSTIYDLTNMDKGIYFLRIYLANKISTHRVIVN